MVGRKRKIRRNIYKSGIRQRRQNRLARLRRTLLAITGLFFFGGFNLALILAHDWLTQTPLIPIEAVQVEGAQRLSADSLRRQAGIAREGNLLGVNLGKARRRLQAHPWIADARVIREIPNRIIIRVQEHDCRAVLRIAEREFLISAAGTVFKKRQDGECADVPVISGIDYADLGLADDAPGKALAAALAVLDPQKGAVPIGPPNRIKEIRADPNLGLTLFVRTPGASPTYRTIILGFADWQQKTRKLSAIQSYLGRRGLMPDAQIFNLLDPDRIVISPAAHAARVVPPKEV